VTDGDITLVLGRIDQGDPTAGEQLLPLVYDELRRLAAAKMAREAAGHTLQPTALVHEAWIRLDGGRQLTWANRAHFFAAAAECMRRILIDRARSKRAVRHGGGLGRVSADSTGFDLASPEEDDEELLLLNEALEALAAVDPRKAELVKQKYFVGLTLEDAADLLGISHSTAHRDWAYARSWLFHEMKRRRG
jgi:RNA polymerase sigma factor (TIGR02999 family)